LVHGQFLRRTHAASDAYREFCYARAKEAQRLVAVVATLSKGHDLTSASSTSHTICYSATPGRL
jgi:hypothetical protein